MVDGTQHWQLRVLVSCVVLLNIERLCHVSSATRFRRQNERRWAPGLVGWAASTASSARRCRASRTSQTPRKRRR
jgi:hypothetical protein